MDRRTLTLCTALALLLPLAAWGQSKPPTLEVEMNDKAELCYDLQKIEKITFQNGSLQLWRLNDGKQFNPTKVEVATIGKVYFSTSKDANENEGILSPIPSSLSYSLREGLLTISGLKKEGCTVSLYTVDGRLLFRGETFSSSLTLDVSSWASGFYLLTTSQAQTLKITLP